MTPEEVLQKRIEQFRGMPPQQRLQFGFCLNAMMRDLIRAVVRHQHPDWDANQVDMEARGRFSLGAEAEIAIDLDEASTPVIVPIRPRDDH